MPSSAPTAISTLSLHDALPIYQGCHHVRDLRPPHAVGRPQGSAAHAPRPRHAVLRRGHSADADVPFGLRHRHQRPPRADRRRRSRSEEHTSELQSRQYLVCRLLRPPPSPPFPYTTLFRSIKGATMSAISVRRTLSVARKEVLHMLRDPATLFFVVAIPLMQTFLLGYAIDTNVRHVPTAVVDQDRKSTRLNSSHANISYAVFCAHRHLHPFPTRRSSDLSRVPPCPRSPSAARCRSPARKCCTCSATPPRCSSSWPFR